MGVADRSAPALLLPSAQHHALVALEPRVFLQTLEDNELECGNNKSLPFKKIRVLQLH